MIVKIIKKLYDNPQTTFHIALAKITEGIDCVPSFVKIYNEEIVLKGFFPLSTIIELNVDGEWQKDKNNNYCLYVKTFKEITPTTEKGIVLYLSSFINGLQKKTAQKIVDQFHLDTIDIMEYHPEYLLRIRGIGRKKLEKIIESFNATRSIQQIVSFLTPFGITPNRCLKIAKYFGGDSLSVILNEPFRLCSISGFGFKTVDEIARKTTYSAKEPLRIQAAIKYVLQQASAEGHLCLPQKQVLARSYLLLNDCKSSKAKIENAINIFENTRNKKALQQLIEKETVEIEYVISEYKDMAYNNILKGDSDFCYLSQNYDRECDIANILAKRLKRKAKATNKKIIFDLIKEQEESFQIKLASKQKEAVLLGVENDTCIITGGPGVGKTTVLKVILAVLKDYLKIESSDVTLLAPTGRAAQRMAESVGSDYSASTIHSALQINGEEEDDYVKSTLIETKIVVVDEASMIDNYICWKLLSAIPDETKLIIIGDPEQLPSVGAGNILYELIECKQIPMVRLDVIYRQQGTNPIVINSGLIQKGIAALKYDDKFQFIKVRNKNDFADNKDASHEIQKETADNVIKQYINAVNELGLEQVQVLCPMRKKGIIAGAYELNKSIQSIVNKENKNKPEIKIANNVFRVGDKVIQTKNNNNLGIYNGDIGFIKNINKSAQKVNICFIGKDEISLDFADLADIDLAYAISIHKSQGSEYKTVIIPMITSFYSMLKRNLIYTGITRAKDKVILVGQKKAIAQAIHTNVIAKRNTQLGKKIIKKMEEI